MSEGEMPGGAALSPSILEKSDFRDPATILMPNIEAANISYNLVRAAAGNGTAVGGILMGAAKPAHVFTPSANVCCIVKLTAVAVADAASLEQPWASRNLWRSRLIKLAPLDENPAPWIFVVINLNIWQRQKAALPEPTAERARSPNRGALILLVDVAGKPDLQSNRPEPVSRKVAESELTLLQVAAIRRGKIFRTESDRAKFPVPNTLQTPQVDVGCVCQNSRPMRASSE
jgi:hypothetical protein